MWGCYLWMDRSQFHSSTFVVLPFFDIATLSSIVIFNLSLSWAFHCLWTLSFVHWSLHRLARLGRCCAIFLGHTCLFKHIQISTFSAYLALCIVCVRGLMPSRECVQCHTISSRICSIDFHSQSATLYVRAQFICSIKASSPDSRHRHSLYVPPALLADFSLMHHRLLDLL